MEGARFCSCWNGRLLWIQICLPARNASAKIANRGLVECLVNYHGTLHSTASDQGTHFTQQMK